jgi:hypothetical protein
MSCELFFQGRKITDRERLMLEEIFDAKIDDLYLCQSILLAAMRPENVLARAAFTRALTRKRCAFHEGGRAAKKLIRRTRRKLGYRVTLDDRVSRLKRNLRKTRLLVKLLFSGPRPS